MGGIHVGRAAVVIEFVSQSEVRMKRSQVNDIMVQADDMIRSFGFTLPPFAYWVARDVSNATPPAARPIIEAAMRLGYYRLRRR